MHALRRGLHTLCSTLHQGRTHGCDPGLKLRHGDYDLCSAAILGRCSESEWMAIGSTRLVAGVAVLVLFGGIAGAGISRLLTQHHGSDAARAGVSKVGSDVPPAVAGARKIGRLPATGMMSVQVLLADRSDVNPAEDFLRRSHLKVTDMSDVGLIVATGPVRAMEDVFAVRLATWQNDTTHRKFYANDRPATLPFRVKGIFGLDNAVNFTPDVPRIPSHLPLPPLPLPLPAPLPPSLPVHPGHSVAEFQKAYNAVLPNIDGAGQRVAIYAHTGFDLNDITRFSEDNRLPAATVIAHKWNTLFDLIQSGSVYSGRVPSSEAPLAGAETEAQINAQAEVTVDIETVHAIAPKAAIDVYEMVMPPSIGLYDTSQDDKITPFLVAAASQGETILSISSGGCENALGSNAPRYAELTSMLASRNNKMSIFAASGDKGRRCYDGTDNAPVGVNWPASDPSVTGVGGTHLDLNPDSTLKQELAWDRSSEQASGGGESNEFQRPPWQTGNGLTATRYRMVPDVSANADNDSSLVYYVGGSAATFGGTSQGAPLWAGIAALYNQYAAAKHAPPLGPANEMLYKLPEGDHPLFDVTQTQNPGDDLAGPAKAGWDMATGLGSPNVAGLIHDGVAAALLALPGTDLLTMQPWVTGAGPAGLSVPLPGVEISDASGTCDSGSADDPGRASAFRCHATDGTVGNGMPCFADTASGDPGSPLLCSTDPTNHRLVRLSQLAGAQLPLQLANVNNPAAPPWFIILGNGDHCHYAGYGTNTKNSPYDCGHGLAASTPDRATPFWTVREAQLNGVGGQGPPVQVLRAIS
jgi:kumamolisin